MAIPVQSYKIVKDPSGARFVKLASGDVIPAGIAGLAAGPDKWLSEIKCKCRDCGELFPLSELGESGQWCEECATAGIED